jgi:hypothetical protein
VTATASDFDLAEWALVARAWNAFRTPGVPQHDRISAELGRTVASGCGADRTPDVQQPPPPKSSRWARLADRVSPSGKVVYRCGRCGRDSVTMDRQCPAGCGG